MSLFKGHLIKKVLFFGKLQEFNACMALFSISYSIIQEISRWDKSDFYIVLVNGDALYKTLDRQALLTAENLPRKF